MITNLTINLKTLIDNDLTPNQYTILFCLKNNLNPKIQLVGIPDSEYSSLISKMKDNCPFLRAIPDIEESDTLFPYALTGEGLSLFEEVSDVSAFSEEYRNLFPKGVKSGNGTPIKGDRTSVLKKMQWFLDTYPEFSKKTIIEATKLYIESMRRNGYKYMTQADYLIKKDNSSKLASMCEDFDDKSKHVITSGEKRI